MKTNDRRGNHEGIKLASKSSLDKQITVLKAQAATVFKAYAAK